MAAFLKNILFVVDVLDLLQPHDFALFQDLHGIKATTRLLTDQMDTTKGTCAEGTHNVELAELQGLLFTGRGVQVSGWVGGFGALVDLGEVIQDEAAGTAADAAVGQAQNLFGFGVLGHEVVRLAVHGV